LTGLPGANGINGWGYTDSTFTQPVDSTPFGILVQDGTIFSSGQIIWIAGSGSYLVEVVSGNIVQMHLLVSDVPGPFPQPAGLLVIVSAPDGVPKDGPKGPPGHKGDVGDLGPTGPTGLSSTPTLNNGFVLGLGNPDYYTAAPDKLPVVFGSQAMSFNLVRGFYLITAVVATLQGNTTLISIEDGNGGVWAVEPVGAEPVLITCRVTVAQPTITLGIFATQSNLGQTYVRASATTFSYVQIA
jgi:hypothetical protein